jgi:hypothetical protein
MTAPEQPTPLVRIWSDEHGAYWREGGCGYTIHAPGAWLLPLSEAERQTAHCGPEKKIVLEPATDIATLAAQRAAEAMERAERVGRGLELNDVACFLEGWAKKGPPGWQHAARTLAHHVRNGAHRDAATPPPGDVCIHDWALVMSPGDLTHCLKCGEIRRAL